LHVEREPGDHAERAHPDHHPGETLILARHLDQVTLAGDQLQAGDGGGEVAILVARAVRRRGDGPGDRDVGQRGHVVQRPTRLFEHKGNVAIAHAATHGHGPRVWIDRDQRLDPLQRDQLGRVGDAVE
jgi:hypothetical protein